MQRKNSNTEVKFIDSHVHIVETGIVKKYSLANCKSIEEILEKIKKDERDFVEFYQLIPYNLKEKRLPLKDEIDKVESKRPVIIVREDLHSCVINSKAEEILKIKTKDGLLRGKDFEKVMAFLKERTDEEKIKEAIFYTAKICKEKNVWAISGLFSNIKEYLIFKEIEDKIDLKVTPFIQTWNIDEVLNLGLKQIGGCLLVDGSISSRTSAFKEGYRDAPGEYGILYKTEEEIYEFVKKANDKGLRVALHAIGDRAVEVVVKAYERVGNAGNRIEHAESITEEQLDIVAKYGIILSMQPSFCTKFKNLYIERLGKERAMRLNPLKSAFKRGIILAFGSDSPVTDIDPEEGIRSAMNHPNEKERLTYKEALKCFTEYGKIANNL